MHSALSWSTFEVTKPRKSSARAHDIAKLVEGDLEVMIALEGAVALGIGRSGRGEGAVGFYGEWELKRVGGSDWFSTYCDHSLPS